MAAHVLLGNPNGVAPDSDALLFFSDRPLLRRATYPDPLIELTRRAFAADISAYPEPFCTVRVLLKLPDICDRHFGIFCFRYLMSKSPNSPCNPPIIGFLSL